MAAGTSNVQVMARFLLAALVVLADVTLTVASRAGDNPIWTMLGYATDVIVTVALRYRSAAWAFVAALVISAVTGAGFVLLLWAAYQAGRDIVSRTGTVVAVGAASGSLAFQLVMQPVRPQMISQIVSVYLMFVAL